MSTESTPEDVKHYSADNVEIVVGGKYWDNNLRVCTITKIGKQDPRPYGDSGEFSTWHDTTDGMADTMTGHMRPFSRLAKRFEGRNADDYEDGTEYNAIK